ncbi:hypothetical protein ABTQ33_04795 [Paucilactobacillus suebicus]|uniref:Uncharacterized protein n=1 Tax=Paucilactobacillus suebicus DSM 5007 = KCTC 3549 TaxID=1423807 RepID=A0A0R1W3J8_9LACO|nr:hypothetical protein [Paucilactobacillus suebicus]KRM12263.1 hypothetical protein FD16_GL002448 [Paucilactobacillus suebicus DSM 5007 = KCTC 3549]
MNLIIPATVKTLEPHINPARLAQIKDPAKRKHAARKSIQTLTKFAEELRYWKHESTIKDIFECNISHGYNRIMALRDKSHYYTLALGEMDSSLLTLENKKGDMDVNQLMEITDWLIHETTPLVKETDTVATD